MEVYLEAGATPSARQTVHLTAMMARNLAHKCQAKTDAAIAVVTAARRTVKRLENPFPFLGWDTRPAVSHTELRAASAPGH
jgi:hypothetical protein